MDLNGTKSFVSGAGSTDVLVVMARTGEHKTKDIFSFVVPAKAKGVSYGANEKKLGWHSQPTRIVNFDQAAIPEGNILGRGYVVKGSAQPAKGDEEYFNGFKIALHGLNGGRVNIGACSVGAGRAAFQHAVRYMKEREQFGQKLSAFQALRFKIAQMAGDVLVSRQMIHLAAAKLDQKNPDSVLYCALAKKTATDKCFDVCNTAMQIYGGYGYTRDYPLERLMRDARVHQIVEGTNDIMNVIIARAVLDKNFTNFS